MAPNSGCVHPSSLSTLHVLLSFGLIPNTDPAWVPSSIPLSPPQLEPVRAQSATGFGVDPTEMESWSKDISQGKLGHRFTKKMERMR